MPYYCKAYVAARLRRPSYPTSPTFWCWLPLVSRWVSGDFTCRLLPLVRCTQNSSSF